MSNSMKYIGERISTLFCVANGPVKKSELPQYSLKHLESLVDGGLMVENPGKIYECTEEGKALVRRTNQDYINTISKLRKLKQ